MDEALQVRQIVKDYACYGILFTCVFVQETKSVLHKKQAALFQKLGCDAVTIL